MYNRWKSSSGKGQGGDMNVLTGNSEQFVKWRLRVGLTVKWNPDTWYVVCEEPPCSDGSTAHRQSLVHSDSWTTDSLQVCFTHFIYCTQTCYRRVTQLLPHLSLCKFCTFYFWLLINVFERIWTLNWGKYDKEETCVEQRKVELSLITRCLTAASLHFFYTENL